MRAATDEMRWYQVLTSDIQVTAKQQQPNSKAERTLR